MLCVYFQRMDAIKETTICSAVCCCMIFSLWVYSASASDFGPCGGKPADVFFVLDSSGSIYLEDFRKELRFTQDIADMFDIDSGKVKVGALSFSQTVNPQFGLGEYSDKTDLLRKISQIGYEGKGTNTAEALSYLYSKGMSVDKVRPGIPHIGIVLTDGMSQTMKATLQEAKRVHEAGITVFVIGIGDQVDKAELEAMGSRPSNNYVFMIDSFDALGHIKEELAIKACEVEAVTHAPNIQNMQADVEDELTSFGSCTPREMLDIVFAVDTAAMGASNSKYVLQFIGNISDHINMASGEVAISTINNGCTGGEFDDEPATDSMSVKQGLATYEAPKFETLMRNMRLKAADGRSQSKHIAVMFVADRLSPAEYGKARREMMRAKFQKSAIFAIGIGDMVDESQIKSLVTNGGQVLKAYSFRSLGDVSTTFVYKLCMFGFGL